MLDLRQCRRRLTGWLNAQAASYHSEASAHAAIGRDAGVSAEMVRKWRKSENWPGAPPLFRLAHRRGLDLNWLAGLK